MELLPIPGPAMMGTNTFLLFSQGGHAVAVDPAAPARRYLQALEQRGAALVAILLTHGHYDHVGAVRELVQATGADVYLDAADLKGDRLYPLRAGEMPFRAYPADGGLMVDELAFRFYPTPGHTRGSHCIYIDGLLLTGDTLFAGSCGRVDLEGGDAQQMRRSLALLRDLPLPDTTVVLPGHDRQSTLGAERQSNPYLRGAWL